MTRAFATSASGDDIGNRTAGEEYKRSFEIEAADAWALDKCHVVVYVFDKQPGEHTCLLYTSWDAHFTLIYDENQEFKRAMNVTNTPQVFILDKNGKQVYAHTGYMPGGEAELLEVIRKLK